ncbi:WD40 repeat-like protein [Lenzites betulinus]|nr:WD40 repeat-like protein [Lenzites betulinus]
MAERLNPNMLFANFNQDFTCISVGTRKGYSITNCDPFGRVYTMNDGARGIVEMLFCTSLLALVGAADHPHLSPRKLQIVNTKRQSMICELLFPSSILAVKMNRKTLVIVLEVEIYIYDISNMKLLHVIETTPNPNGEYHFSVRETKYLSSAAIVALSPSADNSYLAYPSPVPSPALAQTSAAQQPSPAAAAPSTGDVLLFSTRSLTVANVIQAHKSPISFLSVNSSGTMLATASDKGTVIRVWSIPGAEKLYQFRRGTREARIYSINFNLVSTLLVVSSAHDTVHIFKLGQGQGQGRGAVSSAQSPSSPSGSIDSREGSQGLDGGYDAYVDKKKGNSVSSTLRRKSLHLTKNLTSSVGGYLPNTLTEMWEPSRDFAFLRLPTSGARCIAALSGTMPQVMVISSEGYFYSYNIDLENGGECSLMKQYSLLDSNDEKND